MAHPDFTLNEPLILAMMARLKDPTNGVAATVAQVNAERSANTSPPVVLEAPVQIIDRPPIAADFLRGFPIVALADGDIRFVDDVGWSATMEVDITLLAYVHDTDPDRLAWKLRRYAQVLATIGLYGRHVDSGAWGTTLNRILPGRRLSRVDAKGAPTGELMSWVAVIITAKDEQDTP